MNLETIPAGYLPSPIGAGDRTNNSDNPDGGSGNGNPKRGEHQQRPRLRVQPDNETSTTVVDFMASYIAENRVQVEWTATDVTDIAWYNLYRSP